MELQRLRMINWPAPVRALARYVIPSLVSSLPLAFSSISCSPTFRGNNAVTTTTTVTRTSLNVAASRGGLRYERYLTYVREVSREIEIRGPFILEFNMNPKASPDFQARESC